jgi:hypothetical protein
MVRALHVVISASCNMHRYSNGAFCIDMPRGCVLVMHPGGYAVTGVKHCVRPMDMTGEHVLFTRCCNSATTDMAWRGVCRWGGAKAKGNIYSYTSETLNSADAGDAIPIG